jgi:hypothetical protein
MPLVVTALLASDYRICGRCFYSSQCCHESLALIGRVLGRSGDWLRIAGFPLSLFYRQMFDAI